VAIDLKQIKGFAAHAKELAVVVEDGGVVKAKQRMIFMIAEAYIVTFALVSGSITAHTNIPQQAIW
jgi:hypothetical protein